MASKEPVLKTEVIENGVPALKVAIPVDANSVLASSTGAM